MKKIVLLGIAFFALTYAFGQEQLPAEAAQSSEKVMRINPFSSNWFFQLQGGGSLSFNEGHKKTNLTDLIAPYAGISIGKHFAPTVGARFQVGGWQSKSYDVGLGDTYNTKYVQASVDGMLNLSNIFIPYTHEKFFNVYALMGVGYVHGFKNSDMGYGRTNSIVPRAGVQFDFRLNDVMSINLEAIGNLMPDNFNGKTGGKKYDGTLNVMAGLSLKLGGRSFEVVDYIDPAEIRKLSSEIDKQNALLNERETVLGQKDREISNLKAELDKKPNVVVETETIEYEETVMNAVVVFKIGTATLQDNQEINIYNAAKFFQDHPNVDILVTGYADKATGNPALNQRISEQRAKAVADVLIKKYGIAAERVSTQASGDKVQPFQIDAWNRVVVFTAVPKK